MQHTLNTECSSIGKGISSVQIGQKSPSGLSCPWRTLRLRSHVAFGWRRSETPKRPTGRLGDSGEKDTMALLRAAMAAAAALALGNADAFQPWHSSARVSLAVSAKGFGAKTDEQKPKQGSRVPPVVVAADTDELPPLPAAAAAASPDAGGGGGSKLLAELRSREAEKRDMELTKLRELRETDRMLQEDGGAAAIPERVAQRMGKRMLPFVGVPLFGSIASFVGFW